MAGKPFEWKPVDSNSCVPPTMRISCPELGAVGVDATLGKRTAEGYRMGVRRALLCPRHAWLMPNHPVAVLPGVLLWARAHLCTSA